MLATDLLLLADGCDHRFDGRRYRRRLFRQCGHVSLNRLPGRVWMNRPHAGSYEAAPAGACVQATKP